MNLINDRYAFISRRLGDGHLRKTVHRRGKSETMPGAITRDGLRDVFLIPHKSARLGRWRGMTVAGVGFPGGEDVISGGINQSTPSRCRRRRERERERERERPRRGPAKGEGQLRYETKENLAKPPILPPPSVGLHHGAASSSFSVSSVSVPPPRSPLIVSSSPSEDLEKGSASTWLTDEPF